MARPKTIHRADFDGYTECGRLIESSDLVVQPVDASAEPTTCGACLKQLRQHCTDCGADIIAVRRLEYDHWSYNPDSKTAGQTYMKPCCPVCGRTFPMYSRPLGYHRRRLETKERLRQQRERTAEFERQRQERKEVARRLAEDERAEHGVLVHGCAACGKPAPQHPDPRWHTSEHRILNWTWCPEHYQIGVDLDQTLIAEIYSAARTMRAEILKRVSQRQNQAQAQPG